MCEIRVFRQHQTHDGPYNSMQTVMKYQETGVQMKVVLLERSRGSSTLQRYRRIASDPERRLGEIKSRDAQ